jgi:hypothetical protein
MNVGLIKVIAAIATVLALLAALFFAEQYIEGRGYSRARAEDTASTEALKAQAAATLAVETKAKLDAQTALSNLIATTERDRETLQTKNTADLRTHSAGPRLQFSTKAGCGSSSGGAQSPAPGAAPDPEPTVVQLPAEIDGRLRELAADAQSVAIDYGVLFGYVHNPKLVCELQP